MRRTRLLMALAVVGGLMVAGQTPAQASHSCADASAMTAGQSDTVQGTTGLFEASDWWRHDARPSPRTITVSPVTGGEIDLFVHDSCASGPICVSTNAGADTCVADVFGTIWIEVRYRVSVGASGDYSLTVSVPPPTQCSDGVDNDGDGLVDFQIDPNCTSGGDATEAPVRSALTGGVTWHTNTTRSPLTIAITRWGTFATHYSCHVPSITPIRVVCDALPDPEVEWVCEMFPLRATAPAPPDASNSTAQGFVSSWMGCDSGQTFRTAGVSGRGTTSTDSRSAGVTLGTGYRVTCGSAGPSGSGPATGSFDIQCGPFDPGVVWPYGEPPVEIDVITL